MSGPGKAILIVEDEPALASVLKDCFTQHGFSVDHVADGRIELGCCVQIVFLGRLDGRRAGPGRLETGLLFVVLDQFL